MRVYIVKFKDGSIRKYTGVRKIAKDLFVGKSTVINYLNDRYENTVLDNKIESIQVVERSS